MYLLQLNNTLSLGQHRVWKRMAVKWSGAKAGDAALDVCCGSGDLAFLLSEAVGVSGQVPKFFLRRWHCYACYMLHARDIFVSLTSCCGRGVLADRTYS